MTAAEDSPRPRGIGPVMTADDGATFQASEDDVWDAMPATAAALIVMAAWDFHRQAKWTLGERTYYFSEPFRDLVLATALAVAAAICLAAYRDAKVREERERAEATLLEEARRGPGQDQEGDP